MILLNFAHPLAAAPRASMERCSGQALERVIEVKTQLNHNQPCVAQVRQVVEAVGLSSEEWQSLPLVVHLSSLSVVAALAVAELHGRCGYFPAVLRLKPVPDTTSLQLFGRPRDRLSHVLVSEDFETHPDFFYIPPTPHELDVKDRSGHLIKRISTADAQIHLADIPFTRLQGVRSKWLPGSGRSYSDFVQQAQGDLDLLDSSHELRINAGTKTIVVANRAIKLTERELLIYALLAYLR